MANFRMNRETFMKLAEELYERYDLLDCVNDLFQFWAVSVHTRPE